MKFNLERTAQLTRHIPRALQLTWTAARYWTIAWAIMLVVQGLLPAAGVYLTKLLVDSLVVALGSGGDWAGIQPAVLYASLMAGVMLLTQVLQSIMSWIRTAQSEYFSDYINERIQAKAVEADLAYYETSEYYDRMHRVLSMASTQPLALLETLGGIVQHTITLLAVAALLIPYGVWLPVVLLVGTLPAFWVLVQYNRRYHTWWEGTTEPRRRTSYFNQMLTTSFYAPEVRLFGLGKLFSDQYSRIRARLRGERLDLEKQHVLAKVGAGVIALIVTGGTMVWMGWRAVSGSATLGDLALFYRAFDRGQSLMQSVLGSVGNLHRNTLFLEHLFEFLDQRSQVIAPPNPQPVPERVQQEIRLNNVTFCYPRFDTPVLKNFSLTIPAGKTVAIVGENGAGKTTLLKLLSRFYDPTEGSVTFDGIDLRAFDPSEYRRRVAVLFQFPANYQSTALESIALGALNEPIDRDRAQKAAMAAGIHERILQLPKGYDTPLGMWFSDGHELSGGEWQRVAMARAFYRRAPFVILDEPTSMMDSWAEAEWFDRFRELSLDASALIITHRFTIARRADIIHVVQAGQIVESGSHDALLALNGLYAQSWRSQVQSEGDGSIATAQPPQLPTLETPAPSPDLPDLNL